MKFFKSKVKKIEFTSKYNLFVMSDINMAKNNVILIWEYYKDFICIVLFCCFGKLIACKLPALRTILLTDLFLKKNIYLAFLIFTVHLIKQLLQLYFVSLINVSVRHLVNALWNPNDPSLQPLHLSFFKSHFDN